MEHTNKTLLWTAGIIVAIGIIVWIALASGASQNTASSEQATTTADTSLQAPSGVEDVSAGSVDATPTKGTAPATLSYAQALVRYADRRIQLDAICTASPNTLTYKNNTAIMIDNRSAVARTIHLGGVYSIKPYGFKIVNLSLPKLPGTLYLDCGRGQNEATILIQK